MLDRVTRAKPAKAGKIFGAPGDGASGMISLTTSLVLIALWFLVTDSGWVKPLFLPSPLAVWDKFVLALTEGVSNSTLIQHTLASLARVFGAFALAARARYRKREARLIREREEQAAERDRQRTANASAHAVAAALARAKTRRGEDKTP